MRWLIATAAAAALAAAIVWLLAGRGAGPLAPELVAALVAVEPEGTGVAVAGRVEVAADRPFTLRAVLVARDWRGRPVFYTEASRLVVEGAEVPQESIRPWQGGGEARPLWFTVEGFTPFLEVASLEALERFEFREQFRSDWPFTWSVPGTVVPSWVAAAAAGAGPPVRFGIQRYHVRIELFGPQSPVVPRRRFRSPGAEALPHAPEAVTTVIAALEGPLARASGWFGLSQLEPAGPESPRIREAIAGWAGRRLVFSRAVLLLDHLRQDRLQWDDLVWQAVETDGSVPWTGSGDLLRAGGRVVLSYLDEGVPGRLDDGDRVLDFERGARVLALGEVFIGDGLVERARIGAPGG